MAAHDAPSRRPDACCSGSTSRTRTTTAARCSSASTRSSTSRPGTAATPAIPGNRAQRMGTRLGKLLRHRRRHEDGHDRRARLPQSVARDARPHANRFLIGDVGQDRREEVDIWRPTTAGLENYGWRRYEGTLHLQRLDLPLLAEQPGQADAPVLPLVGRVLDHRRVRLPRQRRSRRSAGATSSATTATGGCGASASRAASAPASASSRAPHLREPPGVRGGPHARALLRLAQPAGSSGSPRPASGPRASSARSRALALAGCCSDGTTSAETTGGATSAAAPPPTAPRPPRSRTRFASSRSPRASRVPFRHARAGRPTGIYVVEQTGRIQVIEDGRCASEPLLDLSDSRVVLRRAGTPLGRVPSRTTRRTGGLFVDYTNMDGDTRVVEFPPIPPRRSPIRLRPRSSSRSSSRSRTTTAASSPSGPTGSCTWGWATAAAAAIRTGTARTSQGAARQAAQPRHGRLGRRRGRWRRTACGTRGASRSTARTGTLYIGDVGQGAWEEIDAVAWPATSLVNFGWNVFEGTIRSPAASRIPRARSSIRSPSTTTTRAPAR